MILDKNCLLPVVSVYLIEVDILCGCFQNIIDFLFDDHRGKDSHVEFRDHLSHLAKLANKIHGYFHLRNIKEKEKLMKLQENLKMMSQSFCKKVTYCIIF